MRSVAQAALLLCVLLLPALPAHSGDSISSTTGGADGAQLSPRYEVVRGVDVVWQIPEHPTSVLLLLHGFDSSALIFWDPQPGCPRCVGMPEDRALTLAALARGYAVIAVSSAANWVTAWPPEASADVANVVAITKDWRQRNGLLHLPFTALGTSHGGRFLSGLATVVDFAAVVIMISAGTDDAFREVYARATYPPTLFVHMPKDAITEADIQSRMAGLAQINVPFASVVCDPIPVYHDYFTQRIPGMTPDLSATLVDALRARGYLDSRGFVAYNSSVPEGWVGWYDPVDWGVVLDELEVFPVPGDMSSYWRDAVIQEVRLADAFHSTTSLPTPEIFQWLGRNFEQQPDPLPLLHQQHVVSQR